MNNKGLLAKAGQAGTVLGAALLTTLTGCVAYVDPPRAEVAYVGPPPVEAAVVIQDDYVYYPGYDVYFNSYRHLYYWQEGGVWVSRPSPRGVSVNVLFASPSVRMDFHDSPAHHHAEVVRRYPRSWAPPGGNRGQRDGRPDDRREEREGERGR
jgi:hypothetical protein